MASHKMSPQIRSQIAANHSAETASSVQGIPNEFKKQINENVKAMPHDALNQLLGIGEYKTAPSESKDMTPGQEFVLPKKAAKAEAQHQERKPDIAAANHYHAEMAHASERSNRHESQELKMQIEQIMFELKRLVDSSDKVLQMAYADVSVSSSPKDVGKYHANFFAFLFIVIQQARQKVEDSGAWLSVAKSKGGKKSYQMQSKKNGTSFSLSSERSTATQTG